MRGIHEASQFSAEGVDLIVIEDLHAGEKAVSMEGLNLLVREAVLLPDAFVGGRLAEGAGGCVEFGKVLNGRRDGGRGHGCCPGNGMGRGPSQDFLHQ